MNAYLKIGIASGVSVYVAPMIMKVIYPSVDPAVSTGQLDTYAVFAAGVTGLVAAGVFTLLGMATGGGGAA